jgi:hypothetical protein
MKTYHYHYTGQDLQAVTVDKSSLSNAKNAPMFTRAFMSACNYGHDFGLQGSWIEYDGTLMYQLVQQDSPTHDPIIINCPAKCCKRL